MVDLAHSYDDLGDLFNINALWWPLFPQRTEKSVDFSPFPAGTGNQTFHFVIY